VRIPLGGVARGGTECNILLGITDDWLVDPELRGSGAVNALLAKMIMMALERHWDTMRWTTADNNYRAGARTTKSLYGLRGLRMTPIARGIQRTKVVRAFKG
jgi:hypothetical protein